MTSPRLRRLHRARAWCVHRWWPKWRRLLIVAPVVEAVALWVAVAVAHTAGVSVQMLVGTPGRLAVAVLAVQLIAAAAAVTRPASPRRRS